MPTNSNSFQQGGFHDKDINKYIITKLLHFVPRHVIKFKIITFQPHLP